MRSKSLIAAMSGILAGISHHDLPQRAFRVSRIRTHKRYPEQSSRQAMRAHHREKAVHHCITTAAALANWHAAALGKTNMRPGVDPAVVLAAAGVVA